MDLTTCRQIVLREKTSQFDKDKWFVRLEDAEVDYDVRFRLFVVSKLANPKFGPVTRNL